jgi:peptidoglycan-associated lipoprotein
MRTVRLVFLLLILLSSTACSLFGKGGRGSGDSDLDGNIPGASAGDILKDVNFAFDSSALAADAQGVLRANAQYLSENSGVSVIIEGHCDERGTNEYNMALGERRARAVYDFLRTLGISGDRMSTISYGEEIPLDPRSTEDAWAKNRRAHFSIR